MDAEGVGVGDAVADGWWAEGDAGDAGDVAEPDDPAPAQPVAARPTAAERTTAAARRMVGIVRSTRLHSGFTLRPDTL
jgi:hypothetical protein